MIRTIALTFTIVCASISHALAWGQSNGGWAPEHLDYARSILGA